MKGTVSYNVLNSLDQDSHVLNISLVLEYSNYKFYRTFYATDTPAEIILRKGSAESLNLSKGTHEAKLKERCFLCLS
jgi:hypothetical protein